MKHRLSMQMTYDSVAVMKYHLFLFLAPFFSGQNCVSDASNGFLFRLAAMPGVHPRQREVAFQKKHQRWRWTVNLKASSQMIAEHEMQSCQLPISFLSDTGYIDMYKFFAFEKSFLQQFVSLRPLWGLKQTCTSVSNSVHLPVLSFTRFHHQS